MTDQQLYFAIGIPVLATLAALAANVALYVHLSSRVDSLSGRLDSRVDSLSGRLEARVDSLSVRLDGMRKDIIEHLERIEEKFDGHEKRIARLEIETSPTWQ